MVVDHKTHSREATVKLLEDIGYNVRDGPWPLGGLYVLEGPCWISCVYGGLRAIFNLAISTLQVLTAQTGNEAVALLCEDKSDEVVDVILKAHDPPKSNAVRFLQKMKDTKLQVLPVIGEQELRTFFPHSSGHFINSHNFIKLPCQPLVSHSHAAVYSDQVDRDAVARCLSLGAVDYWIKPLRSNEIRNLWTRVWWRQGGAAAAKDLQPGTVFLGESSGDGSDATRKIEEGELPVSRGGSAPDAGAAVLPKARHSSGTRTGTITGSGHASQFHGQHPGVGDHSNGEDTAVDCLGGSDGQDGSNRMNGSGGGSAHRH